MKTPLILLFPLCFLACKETQHPIKEPFLQLKTGAYTSSKFSKTDWIALVMNGYSSHINGRELTLNKDSSFKLKTCGAIETGTWQYKADSLYLFAKTIRWRNDSLQQYGFEGKWLDVPKKPEVFCVLNDTVLKEDIYKKNGNKSLNMLVLQK